MKAHNLSYLIIHMPSSYNNTKQIFHQGGTSVRKFWLVGWLVCALSKLTKTQFMKAVLLAEDHKLYIF